jgi:hypothetical protein
MTDWPGPHLTQNDIERRVIAYTADFTGTQASELTLNTTLSALFHSLDDLPRFARGLNELRWMRSLGLSVEGASVLQAHTIRDVVNLILHEYRNRNPRNR